MRRGGGETPSSGPQTRCPLSLGEEKTLWCFHAFLQSPKAWVCHYWPGSLERMPPQPGRVHPHPCKQRAKGIRAVVMTRASSFLAFVQGLRRPGRLSSVYIFFTRRKDALLHPWRGGGVRSEECRFHQRAPSLEAGACSRRQTILVPPASLHCLQGGETTLGWPDNASQASGRSSKSR